ncbi:hypothetical protein [Bradyrhizobium sp. USDA 4486]
MSSQEIYTPSVAAADRDLIFVVIERHRELSAHYDAAASLSDKLEDGAELAAADEVTGQTNLALREHANVLIRSKPATIAGVIALTRYVAGLREWELPDDSDGADAMTLAHAIGNPLLPPGSKSKTPVGSRDFLFCCYRHQLS